MASPKITSIHDLLEQYNDRIVNQRDKGTSFERLMKSYLELDPLPSRSVQEGLSLGGVAAQNYRPRLRYRFSS